MIDATQPISRSRTWLSIVAVLCTVMLAAWQAGAKPTPPLTMAVAVDNPCPSLGGSESLRVTLTTTRAYTNLAIAVSLPAEIVLVSGKPEWQGSLDVGEKREIVLKVMLKTTGRYTIDVNATFDPAESPMFSAAQISLNIIAGNNGVVASMDDFITMDLNRARTPAEKQQLLGGCGIETQTPAPTGVPAAVPSFLLPADQKEQPAAPQKPESLLNNTISVTVSGFMKYKDKAGVEHPIRFAKVQVLNVNPGSADQVMGEGNTMADGSYSIVATGGDADSGPDIKVRVWCAIMNDAVASVGPNTASTYYMEESAVHTDYAAATLTVSLTTGKPVSGSTIDDDSARRFSVLDAILQYALEACYLRNGNLMPKIPIVFPATGTAYNKVDIYIKVLRKDALDWDVIGHEFAHYLANKGASAAFANSPGGPHDGSSTIPSNGKEKGVRLAWSEGWAGFFPIMAQLKPTQTLLAWPAIPNTGDRIFQDTEDAASANDTETFSNGALTGKGQGYACEFSISGMLYDLCDADVDTSADGLSKDYINVPLKQVWNLLNSGPWDNVGKFYNMLCAAAGYNVRTMLFFSPVFALNNIGPELEAPNEGTVVSSVISPQFKWKANGDPTAGFGHNHFDLVIGKNNFATIVGVKEDIQDVKYTFTDAEWKAIAAQSDDTGLFQWVVTGYNSVEPRLPPTGGLGKFISNTQTFKLRAYHIRMTWNNLGADVDLHLTSPSGSDCYYGNRNPDWGIPGDTTDNPSLDRDCISSCTEENITIDKIVTPGTYRLWVHYYSDHGRGASGVNIEIFKYGRLIGATSRVLSETGDRWDVFNIVAASMGPEVIAEDDTMTKGVTDLPPKQPEGEY